ncbi:TonB-dependent siderophore receptor [Escherichia coli]|uniref:hypothetical protein n=1 Tax=Escherichia coli TaxID=562 RepID=UPI0010D94F27|nr:hypothetical protein [Escherichia coli]GCX51186.1 TonB-dependent siderophore receptor [Escherichia coli]
MLGGADNPNGELPSYITGADTSIFPSGTDGDNGSPSAFIGGGREVRASVTFDF